MSGLVIGFTGPKASGKSTVRDHLANWLYNSLPDDVPVRKFSAFSNYLAFHYDYVSPDSFGDRYRHYFSFFDALLKTTEDAFSFSQTTGGIALMDRVYSSSVRLFTKLHLTDPTRQQELDKYFRERVFPFDSMYLPDVTVGLTTSDFNLAYWRVIQRNIRPENREFYTPDGVRKEREAWLSLVETGEDKPDLTIFNEGAFAETMRAIGERVTPLLVERYRVGLSADYSLDLVSERKTKSSLQIPDVTSEIGRIQEREIALARRNGLLGSNDSSRLIERRAAVLHGILGWLQNKQFPDSVYVSEGNLSFTDALKLEIAQSRRELLLARDNCKRSLGDNVFSRVRLSTSASTVPHNQVLAYLDAKHILRLLADTSRLYKLHTNERRI